MQVDGLGNVPHVAVDADRGRAGRLGHVSNEALDDRRQVGRRNVRPSSGTSTRSMRNSWPRRSNAVFRSPLPADVAGDVAEAALQRLDQGLVAPESRAGEGRLARHFQPLEIRGNDLRRGILEELDAAADDVAVALGMKRSTLSGYENAIAQPGIEALVSFSNYFRVAIDTLVKVDLTKLPESQLRQLEKGYDVFIKGSSLRILATTVGQDNQENIELVTEKAKAGYKSGFADPEYISILPTFRLPFLSKQKKYRTFQISGDSMLPIPEKAWVTGVFVQDWHAVRDRDAYIILTSEEGIVFKVVENKIRTEGKLILHSLNPAYEPYEIAVNDIREIWQFVNYISPEIPENTVDTTYQLVQMVKKLTNEVKAIQTRLNL